MIRVNLLPGGKKQKARGGGGFKLPDFGGLGAISDPWVLATYVLPVVALALVGYLYYSVGQTREEISVALEEARQDSIRFADIREQTDLLRARSDTVAQQVSIIQEIDEGRYVWPHILDETARALPDFTWLTSVAQISGGGEPSFQVMGQAGNNDAIAVFLDQLEASPFIRNVQLVGSTQTVAQPSGQLVYDFELQGQYVQPPLEVLETVPLFGGETVPEETGTAAADTASATDEGA